MTKTVALAVFVALAAAAPAAAQDDLVSLFPSEADVQLDGDGLARLPLTSDVLGATRGDLADVRLFDADDREVPFLIDSGARPAPPAPPAIESIPVTALSFTVEATARGSLAPLVRETYVLPVPGHPSPTGEWNLVIDTPRTRFVRRAEVSDPVTGAPIADASLFRLPFPHQERTAVRLPSTLPSSLRVVVEGTDAPLEAAFHYETERPRETADTFEVPLREIARRREGAVTIVELARPIGIVPDRIRIETATPSFDRPAVVRDAGQRGDARPIGRATLLRVPELAVDERAIRVAPPEGDRLIVAIDDAGSPALESLSVVAIVERPALLFHARGPTTLRFGGSRAHVPGYDLARLAGTPIGRELVTGGVAREATLGPIHDNPRFDPRPALEFAMRPGPAVDPRRSTHHRDLRVDTAPEGLSSLQLDAAELAHARADLADVRVVDDRDRTWPFLLEREGAAADVPIELSPPRREERSSRYDVHLPAAPFAARALLLDPSAAYVDRGYRVHGRIELPERLRTRARPGDDEVLLAEGRLVRRPGETASLRVPLREERVIAMWLVVDDGDDPALAFRSTIAEMPTADLYLVAPRGEYRLLIGDDEAPPAQHEIARARDLVLAVRAAPLTRTGELERNPRFVPRTTGVLATVALWLAILLAVLVLGVLTIRLARREPDPEPPRRGASEPDTDQPAEI